MKATDIEIGKAYLTSHNGIGRYSPRVKATVLRAAGADDKPPRGSRMRQSGHKLWVMRADEPFAHWGAEYESGHEFVVASAWIVRPWTEHDDAARAEIAVWTERNADLESRLQHALNLAEKPLHFNEGTAPWARIRGAHSALPIFELNLAAVERLLERLSA